MRYQERLDTYHPAQGDLSHLRSLRSRLVAALICSRVVVLSGSESAAKTGAGRGVASQPSGVEIYVNLALRRKNARPTVDYKP